MTEPMHADEIDTDADLVRRLLRAQHPQWADLPIERLASDGTDHAIYRLGEELVARLPRIHWATGHVARERRWLPVLAPLLPLRLPVPVASGAPGAGYPFEWCVSPWIEGPTATRATTALPEPAAPSPLEPRRVPATRSAALTPASMGTAAAPVTATSTVAGRRPVRLGFVGRPPIPMPAAQAQAALVALAAERRVEVQGVEQAAATATRIPRPAARTMRPVEWALGA